MAACSGAGVRNTSIAPSRADSASDKACPISDASGADQRSCSSKSMRPAPDVITSWLRATCGGTLGASTSMKYGAAAGIVALAGGKPLLKL